MREFRADGPSGRDGPEPDGSPLVRREIGERQPSTAVVEAVAEARGEPPTDLPPLRETIDPDALDTFVREASEAGLLVGFRFAGHEVRVSGEGVVRVWG